MRDEEMIIDAQAEKPTREDLFYLEWGRETLKSGITTLNDTLKLFITLNVALLSAFVGLHRQIFSNVQPGHPYILMLPPLCFMLALVMAIAGIFPRTSAVYTNSPDEIKRFKVNRVRVKQAMLFGAAFFVIVGLGSLVLMVPLP